MLWSYLEIFVYIRSIGIGVIIKGLRFRILFVELLEGRGIVIFICLFNWFLIY